MFVFGVVGVAKAAIRAELELEKLVAELTLVANTKNKNKNKNKNKEHRMLFRAIGAKKQKGKGIESECYYRPSDAFSLVTARRIKV